MSGSPHTIDAQDLLTHTTWMRALARSLVDDPDSADDLVQDTLLQAIERPPNSDHGDSGLRPWLAVVLHNFARMRRRGEGRRRAREEQVAQAEEQPSASEVVERAGLHTRVAHHVMALPEPYRTTILLRFFDSLSNRELARRAGIREDAARKRVSRGLGLLRERLDAEEDGDRQAWLSALGPLLLAPRKGSLAAGTTAIAALAGLAALVAAFALGPGFGSGGVERTDQALLVADTDASAPPPSDRPDRSRPPARRDTLQLLEGRVKAKEGTDFAGVEVFALARRMVYGEFIEGADSLAELPALESVRMEILSSAPVHSDGTFRLDVDATLTTIDVTLRGGGLYLPISRRVELPHSGLLELAPFAGRMVSGQLLDERGEGLGGVDVRLEPDALRLDDLRVDPADRLTLVTRSDERGHFRFSPVPSELPTLVVALPTAHARAFARVPGTSTPFLTLHLEPGGSVTGRVIGEGARVEAWIDRPGDVGAHEVGVAECDRSGAYRLEHLPLEAVHLRAVAPGFQAGSTRQVIPPGTLDWTLEPAPVSIEATSGIEGQVVDEEGAPVGSFDLLLHRRIAPFAPVLDRRRIHIEDSLGHFHVDSLPAGRYELRAEVAGESCSSPHTLELTTAEQRAEVELTLVPARMRRGQVLDAKGEVAPYARVLAVDRRPRWLRWNQGTPLPEVRADEEGAFVVALPPMDGLGLQGVSSAGSPSEIQWLDPESEEPIVLALRPGATLRGLVTDRSGSPVVGTRVVVEQPDTLEARATTTDTGGAFSFGGLEPGSMEVFARTGDGDLITTKVLLIGGEETGVRLAATAGVRTLEGRVTRNGTPVAGHWIGLVGGAPPRLRTRTDAMGGFSLPAGDAERYRLGLRTPNGSGETRYAEFAVEAPPPGQPLLLELPVGRVRGRVLDPRGLAVEDVRVTLRKSDGSTVIDGTTNEEGRFLFEGLPEGRWILATGGGARHAALTPAGAPARSRGVGFELEDSEDRTLPDQVLGRACTLTVRVFDREGQAVSGARITLLGRDGSVLDPLDVRVTRSDGRCLLMDLGEGPWTLRAEHGGQASPGRNVYLVPGENDEVSLRL